MVEIGNQGATDLGYEGLTDLWFSQYDMPAEDFLDETDRVWDELKPLYDALHCHVRDELSNYYGEEIVPKNGNLPAHLLGNMWGQSWSNIYDIVYTPETQSGSSEINLTNILIEKDIDDNLGIGFDDFNIRACANDCVFCFADQNPPGMREG